MNVPFLGKVVSMDTTHEGWVAVLYYTPSEHQISNLRSHCFWREAYERSRLIPLERGPLEVPF